MTVSMPVAEIPALRPSASVLIQNTTQEIAVMSKTGRITFHT